jgi:hypothetical protein
LFERVGEALDRGLHVCDVVFVLVQFGLRRPAVLLGLLVIGYQLAQAILKLRPLPPD